MARQLALALALGLTLLGGQVAAAADSKKVESQRAEVRKASGQILRQLYRTQPSARKAVEAAAGYATFSNFGLKIVFVGSGSGSGLAVDNSSKKETFMKMVEVQAGLGIGAKKFRLVFVFETKQALDNFVNSGWEAGAQASAAATTGKKGSAYQGALSVSPGVWLYQLTDKGLALEATVKGTKYYKDSDLN